MNESTHNTMTPQVEKGHELIKDALDSLALALADHNHVWSNELRSKYEKAIAAIPNED